MYEKEHIQDNEGLTKVLRPNWRGRFLDSLPTQIKARAGIIYILHAAE